MDGVGEVVLFAAAGVAAGGAFALLLARWRHAFPALFLAGVAVFLAWTTFDAWGDDDEGTVGALTAFFALLGWIAGVTAALTARRGRRALRT